VTPDTPQTLFHQVGYCTQYDSFPKGLSGRQFIYSYLRVFGNPHARAEELAQQALERVGMVDAANRRVAGYSKGMRQRIKLAQAIAHDPPVLFLDEPLNGMDPLGRRATIDLVQQLGEEGRTVVVSSHVLHEVEAMTDTILLINHGRMLAEGNIYEIRQLIDTHPLQVTIRCDNVNVLTAQLLAFEDVKSVHFDRARHQLTVETVRPDEFHRRLPGLALEHGVKIHSLWSPDESLEAVFGYLVR
jgi:ABC-2 type transport system ATP-binding protein